MQIRIKMIGNIFNYNQKYFTDRTNNPAILEQIDYKLNLILSLPQWSDFPWQFWVKKQHNSLWKY